MNYLHTMVRVSDLEKSLHFYRDALGLSVLRAQEFTSGRYTLVFLAAPGDSRAQLELTYNWDPQEYTNGLNFGHLAYAVDDLYETCERLQAHGVILNRPPRDGYMAFVRSPDGISIELLQKGSPMAPADPWQTMCNIGNW
ncbi:VOC family protein [Undibacterium curvum]|uniref:VOC family protein n=1 Tax=Undibacterium curvum TaxID=2762294 RepID=UPI003D0D9A9B